MSDDEEYQESETNESETNERKPCPLFVQLNEYTLSKQDSVKWLEKCRWIKFEEKVEEAGDHWSKPHLGILSTKHIMAARDSLKDAIFSFDQPGDKLEDILDNILNVAFETKKISLTQRNELFYILCKKHKCPKTGLAIKNNTKNESMSSSKINKVEKNKEYKKRKDINTIEDLIEEEKSFHHFHSKLKKKTPIGSEIANLLVAELSVLDSDLMFFIMLKNPLIIGRYSEIQLPTRFIVIMLGPSANVNSNVRLFDQARVLGCLFSDPGFREYAYSAKTYTDLERGIDAFTDHMLIIPPAQWDPDVRIDPPKDKVPQRNVPGMVVNLDNNLDMIDDDEEEDEDVGLTRTSRFCGGLIDDIKRKKKFYLSDFKDALHIQCLSSAIFLFFACITPIITFGGLLMKGTDGYLGTIESIVAGLIVGVVYSLFSGQPLTILGSTGPILVFEKIVFTFCSAYEWNYLSFRECIGIWVFIFMMIFVVCDLSCLVKYITKFTEECFAMLIAVIYIYESFQKVFYMLNDFPVNKGWTPDYVLNRTCECIPTGTRKIIEQEHGAHIKRMLKFEKPPLRDGYNATNLTCLLDYIEWDKISAGYFSWQSHDYKEICVDYGGKWMGNTCGKLYVPDVFVFSWILMLGTFALATGLRIFRSSRLLPNIVRNIMGNFAVVIAIVSFTLIDFISGLHTPKLKVPTKFEPTLGYDTRGWIIHPIGKNPWWSPIAAVLPAIIAGILIFMDQQITAVIVNRKRHKFKKSHGYHLDLLIVALLILVNSILGIPWFVAATVLSLNHVMSLKKESTNNAPGEMPQFLGCREQRVTHLFIFIFVGLSIFLTPVLRLIPMPVLYGVFLYMGVGPLGDMELIQRIGLVFTSPKNRPDFKFLRSIPILKIHLFTFIQVVCFALLWTIKSVKVLSIGFPVMVLALCFIRKGLECCFSYEELKLLDHPLPGAKPDSQSCGCLPWKKKKTKNKPDDQETDNLLMDNVQEKNPPNYNESLVINVDPPSSEIKNE